MKKQAITSLLFILLGLCTLPTTVYSAHRQTSLSPSLLSRTFHNNQRLLNNNIICSIPTRRDGNILSEERRNILFERNAYFQRFVARLHKLNPFLFYAQTFEQLQSALHRVSAKTASETQLKLAIIGRYLVAAGAAQSSVAETLNKLLKVQESLCLTIVRSGTNSFTNKNAFFKESRQLFSHTLHLATGCELVPYKATAHQTIRMLSQETSEMATTRAMLGFYDKTPVYTLLMMYQLSFRGLSERLACQSDFQLNNQLTLAACNLVLMQFFIDYWYERIVNPPQEIEEDEEQEMSLPPLVIPSDSATSLNSPTPSSAPTTPGQMSPCSLSTRSLPGTPRDQLPTSRIKINMRARSHRSVSGNNELESIACRMLSASRSARYLSGGNALGCKARKALFHHITVS